MSGTYEKPKHGWTCFHCGDTFTTPGAARDHFGPTPNAEPGCVIKVQLGGERGLLKALREVEERLTQYMEEDTILHRSMHAMQSRHRDALMSAEEAGYARGLKNYMECEQQRNELLVAIEHFLDPDGRPPQDTGEWREVLRIMASVKGGAV